jgi:hypothetical protein
VKTKHASIRLAATATVAAALLSFGATTSQSSAATKKAITKTVCKTVKGKKTCNKVKIKAATKAKKGDAMAGDAMAGDAMAGTDAMAGDAMAHDTVPTATVKK